MLHGGSMNFRGLVGAGSPLPPGESPFARRRKHHWANGDSHRGRGLPAPILPHTVWIHALTARKICALDEKADREALVAMHILWCCED